MINMAEAALHYAEQGIPVFPCQRDKTPHTVHGFKDATTDANQIAAWWKRWPRAMIGMPTGSASGIDVLDLDVDATKGKDGLAQLPDWQDRSPVIVRTPRGGVHLWFTSDGSMHGKTDTIAYGVDTRGNGNYVIVPPSRNGVGAYRFEKGGEIQYAALPPFPDDLRERLRIDHEPHKPAENLLADDPALITAAMAVIPNDDVPQTEYAKIGLACWAASGGSDIGFKAFDNWARKSTKYHGGTKKRWRGFSKWPPDSIGFGSIKHWADQADPGWQARYDDQLIAERQRIDAEWLDRLARDEQVPPCEDEAEQPRDAPSDGGESGSQAGNPGEGGDGAAAPEADAPQPDAEAKAEQPTGGTGLTPVDLWASFPPPELPAGLLPKVIENYARREARTMGADVAGVAMGALTVCAAAISDSIQLQVKKHSPQWKESARLWVALIGDPSSKKSPILRLVAAPLARIDAKLHRKYIADKAYYDNLPPEEKKKAIPPKQRRVRIEDTTIEASQEVLKDSPDGVLCLQDELSGWFGGMDKYSGKGAAKDRGYWLQSFNGGEYVFNRVSRGSVIIENLSVSLLGGIQPDPMRKLAADSVDDGLLQRACPIILRTATMGQDEPNDGAWKFYDDLVDRLHVMRPPNSVLRFDSGAQAIRQRLEQKHLDLMNCEAVNKKLSAHIGKYDGLFARIVAGRRAGKDSITSLICAYTAALFEPQERLRPGEAPLVLALACDRDQARIVLNYTKSYFSEVPALKSLVRRETATGLRLTNRVEIAVGTNSFRSVRGRSILAAVLDECAFYRDETSATPDEETYRALVPALSTLQPESMLIGISTPYRKAGLLYRKFCDHYGKDDADVLVVQAPSIVLNPTLDPAIIATALKEDPAGASAEWEAKFRDGIGNWIEREKVEAAVDRGVMVRPPRSGVQYHSFVDVNAGGSDFYCAAVAHRENGLELLDCMVEIKSGPGFDPYVATASVCTMLKNYRCLHTYGDDYGKDWVRRAYAQNGIEYRKTKFNRSEIYLNFLPQLICGRARLLDNKTIVSQLGSLERITVPGGHDKVDHPRGQHDDAANVVAGALIYAAQAPEVLSWAMPCIMTNSDPLGLRSVAGNGGDCAGAKDPEALRAAKERAKQPSVPTPPRDSNKPPTTTELFYLNGGGGGFGGTYWGPI